MERRTDIEIIAFIKAAYISTAQPIRVTDASNALGTSHARVHAACNSVPHMLEWTEVEISNWSSARGTTVYKLSPAFQPTRRELCAMVRALQD
jgi:hypothetical protein